MKRVTLKKGREKSVRNRHPWIFSGAIDYETSKAIIFKASTDTDKSVQILHNLYQAFGYPRLALFPEVAH
jgi:hypothetical protein